MMLSLDPWSIEADLNSKINVNKSIYSHLCTFARDILHGQCDACVYTNMDTHTPTHIQYITHPKLYRHTCTHMHAHTHVHIFHPMIVTFKYLYQRIKKNKHCPGGVATLLTFKHHFNIRSHSAILERSRRQRHEQRHALTPSLHAWIQTVNTESYRKQSDKRASR